MGLSKFLLKVTGWKLTVSIPDYPKSIYCVAPHTSNWDFILGELAIHSIGRKAGFLMKSTWFFFPLGLFFKAIGGIPVERKNKKVSLVEVMVEKFKSSEKLNIAITPEGTRKATSRWHTGFLEIARQADVPICLAALDYGKKEIYLTKVFTPSGDNEADIAAIKEYFRPYSGKYPDHFIAD